MPGSTHELEARGRGLGAYVQMRIWSPGDADPAEPLPLLVAHDGPEYDELAGLTQFASVAIRAGELPRHRVALLAPGERDEWYSASARYSGALVRDVLPAVRAAVAVHGAPVGMGASLGALSMLHTQRRHPGTLGAMFLQSGSFFMPRYDAHESRFPRYRRIVRFVRATLRQLTHPDPVPVALTCGTAEENVHNNRVMARGAVRPGLPGRFRRGARHAQLHGLARRVRPAPDQAARARMVSPRPIEVWSAAIGANGASSRTATGAGRCSCSRPSAGAPGTSSRTGMIDAVADLLDGGPGQALLRRLLRLRAPGRTRRSRSRSGPASTGATSRGSSTRSCPWIHADCGGAHGDRHRSASASAPTTRSTSRSSAPTCSRSRLGLSGNYDPAAWDGWGERGDAAYFNNPMDYLAHMDGGHLDWLRDRLSLLLVCGQGQWEDTTGALESSKRLAGLLAEKGIRTSWTSGATTCRTTGPRGEPAGASSATVLLMDDDRTHLIGLLLGTEEDWPTRVRDARLAARPDRGRVGGRSTA